MSRPTPPGARAARPARRGELPGRRCRSHVTAPGARSAARGGAAARGARRGEARPAVGQPARPGRVSFRAGDAGPAGDAPPSRGGVGFVAVVAASPRSRRERVRGCRCCRLRSPLCGLRGRPQARLGSRHEAEAALEAGAGVVSRPWEAVSSLAAVRGCSFLLLLLPLFPSLERARRWPVPAGLSAPFPAGKERGCCDAPGPP